MAAVLGLEDKIVEELCAGSKRVAGELQLPRPGGCLGRERAVDQLLEEAQAAAPGRLVKLRVSGAFHSPLVARAADALRPRSPTRRLERPALPFMSTVRRGSRMPGVRRPPGRAAHRPGRSSRRPFEAAEGVGMFVEVGPGRCSAASCAAATALLQTISVGDPEAVGSSRRRSPAPEGFASLDGKVPRHRRVARDRSGDLA